MAWQHFAAVVREGGRGAGRGRTMLAMLHSTLPWLATTLGPPCTLMRPCSCFAWGDADADYTYLDYARPPPLAGKEFGWEHACKQSSAESSL